MANSFCQLVADAAAARPEKIAMKVVGVDESSYTYERMLAEIRGIAHRLSQEGIQFGERVALIGENHPHWAVAYLGMLFAGVVCVPIDPHGELDTIANFFENSEAKMAFIGDESVEVFNAVTEKLGRKLPAVLLESSLDDPAKLPENDFAKFSDWAKTPLPDGFDTMPTPAKAEDLAVLIYTSGTTGTPKGVPLTHGNIYYEATGCQEVMNISEHEVVLSVLPLFHVFAQVVNLWVIASIGASIRYIKELSPAEMTRAFETREITLLTGVPRLWYLFHKKIFDGVAAQPKPVQWLFKAMLVTNGFLRDAFKINLGRVFFKKVHEGFGGKLKITVSAGSRFDEKIARDYHSLGFTIIQGYGLSETSGAVTATRFEDNVVGSVGKAVNHAEIKIGELNEDGAGEVLIKGKMVFSGYYKNPEATKDAFTEDGWFRSGDLGKLDKKGHLFIVGRSKDVIVLPNGKNVHPEDLEVKYLTSPMVEEIAILGVADEQGSHAGAEKLVGVVVPDFEYLKANNIANSREAIRYELDDLGRTLPEYQRVREYVIHAEPLPRTATRKIKRFQLKKELEQTGFADKKAQPQKALELSAEDRALMETPAGKIVAAAIGKNVEAKEQLHPKMSLELDLGLDSLGRAEVFAALEAALQTELGTDEAAKALTVGDAIALVNEYGKGSELLSAKGGDIGSAVDVHWGKLVRTADETLPEIQPILKRRPLFGPFAFFVYRTFNLFCRIAFRLEVSGLDELDKMQELLEHRTDEGAPPSFIICPNHQSFLDPFVLTSNYPFEIFVKTFHVGAIEFFQSSFMGWLGDLLRVVRVDPDVQLMKAMKAGAVGLRNGHVLNIYPEGQRAYDGKLHEFKRGASILSTELGVPIVPVALDGLYKVWPRNSWRIRFAKVKIKIGKAFYAADIVGEKRGEYTDADYAKVTDHLERTIAEMIEELR
jgi:long-chain acyl-CoA synthetase